MASSETPRLLESPSEISEEIDRRLTEDGLECTEEEKLLYVWKLYQHTESDLQQALENEEKLKMAQTAEMQEVENYVEHIRHLSDEREALIQELETENDNLKQEIEHLKQDQNGSALREETAEMLIQQGLEEIASVSTSEQIAFLLVERARLLDELEAEQNRTITPSVDGRASEDLQKTLEKERNEFEEEISQQRDSLKKTQDQLKRQHEEEINALMEENNKLEDDLVESKEKMEEFQAEIKKLREELQQEKDLREKEKSDSDSRSSTPRYSSTGGRPPSPGRQSTDVALRNIIQEKTKIEGEVLHLKSDIRNLDNDNSLLQEKIKKLQGDLEKVESNQSQLQMKNKGLKSEIEELEQQLEETEALLDKTSKEKEKYNRRVLELDDELKPLRGNNQKIQGCQDVIEVLTNEKKNLLNELEQVKQDLYELSTEKDELSNKTLTLTKSELELSSELDTLKREIEKTKSKEMKFVEQQEELSITLKLLDSATLELEELQNKKEELDGNTEKLSKENKDLLNKMEVMNQELERVKTEGQEQAKQDIITGHLRDQVQKLQKELGSTKDELQQKTEQHKHLQANLEELDNTNTELKHKQEKDIQDLMTKLQMSLTELQKSKSSLDQEVKKCSELQNKIQTLEKLQDEASQTNSIFEAKALELKRFELCVKDLEHQLAVKGSVEKKLNDREKRIDELERELEDSEALRTELEDTRFQLESEQKARAKLEKTIQDLDEIYEDQKIEHENMQQQLLNKVNSLESRVKELQEDLFQAQDELQEIQEENDSEVRTLQEKHESEFKAVQQKYEQELKSVREDFQKELSETKAAKIQLEEHLSAEKHQSVQTQPQTEMSGANVRIETQKVDNLEKQIESMKTRLTEANTKLDQTSKDKFVLDRENRSLKETLHTHEKTLSELESVRRELSSALRELEHLRISAKYSGEERQRHMDRIHSLEDLTKQLEIDNRELAAKLSDTLNQVKHSEEQYKRERQRNTDKNYQNHRHLNQMEQDMEEATHQVRQLRDDLQKKQTYIMKLEADAIGNAAKYESTIARLESELTEVKQYHKKEIDNFQERVDLANKETKDLRNQLRDKTNELSNKEQDASRAKNSGERLESQLQTEVKIRTDLENRNTALDQEITKTEDVWSQVRSLMEKNATLEMTKRNLEDELERRYNNKYAESSLVQHSTSNLESSLKSAQNRADTSERKAEKLQNELSDVSYKMKSVEHQLHQAEDIKHDLQEKKEQVVQLRNQMEGEKLQRTLLDQTVAELKHQVSLLRTRESKVMEQNRELQHTMLDLESKLEEMHDRSQTAIEMDTNLYTTNWDGQQQHMTEVGKRSMMDQIVRLQKEIKDLQYELLTVNERREMQERKYEERKMKTKVKLMRAREIYSKERTRMQEQIGRCEEDLRLTRNSLRKEMDWKEKMDKNYQQLLHDKRELMSQITDHEEELREKRRMVSTLQVRTKFLEEENARLQDRIDQILQQKHALDKLLKAYKVGKDGREISRAITPETHSHAHSITGGTSGIGSNADTSWANEPDHYVDSLAPYRAQTIDNYLNRTYPTGHMIDLYRGETGSEESFGQDYST